MIQEVGLKMLYYNKMRENTVGMMDPDQNQSDSLILHTMRR